MTRTGPSDGAGAVLVGDIGGTNARFGVLEDGKPGHVRSFQVSRFADPVAAIGAYLAEAGITVPVRRVLLAIAAPVRGDDVQLTNGPWTVSKASIAAALNVSDITFVNDFAATAWGVLRLRDEDLLTVGGGETKPAAPAVVFGPGTGVGVSVLFQNPGSPFVLSTEGSHVTMPDQNADEDAIIDILRGEVGHVSVERALSGEGIVNLYRAVMKRAGTAPEDLSSVDITRRAQQGTCRWCQSTMDLYFDMLGGVAGNWALTFDACGGVYIAGGIVPQLTDLLIKSGFRARFQGKGRFSDYLRSIPTKLIIHEYPGLLGLSELAAAGDPA